MATLLIDGAARPAGDRRLSGGSRPSPTLARRAAPCLEITSRNHGDFGPCAPASEGRPGGGASVAACRGEPGRLAQHLGAGAETLERVERRADEALAFDPRRLDAEHVDERRLAFLGILAGALADGIGARPTVEEVVGDLEGGAERLPIGAEILS